MNLASGLFITGIALAGLLIARSGLKEQAARSDVAGRLHTLYTLVGALLLLRLAAPLSASALLVAALMTVASWLPLAGVRLAEALGRRHAPRPIKLMALGGGLAFTLLALTLGLVWSRTFLLALAGFQLVMLTAIIWLLARTRKDVSPAERCTSDTFLLALLITLPLAATDFQALFPDLTLRGGAIAILLLVLATSRLADDRGTPLRLVADLVLVLGAGGLTVFAFSVAQSGLEPELGLLAGVSGTAIAALLLLVERKAARRSDQSGLVAAIARIGEPDDPAAILASHPLLDQGRRVGAEDLASYPEAALERLTGHRVVSRDLDDEEAREAAIDLLDSLEATHLLRISRNPPGFLAISAGALSGRGLNDELEIAARLIEKST